MVLWAVFSMLLLEVSLFEVYATETIVEESGEPLAILGANPDRAVDIDLNGIFGETGNTGTSILDLLLNLGLSWPVSSGLLVNSAPLLVALGAFSGAEMVAGGGIMSDSSTFGMSDEDKGRPCEKFGWVTAVSGCPVGLVWEVCRPDA